MEGGQNGGGLSISSIVQTRGTLWLCHIWTKTIGPFKSTRKNSAFIMNLSQGSKEFAHNVCIVWALSRGLNEDDANFATFCGCQYHHSQGICSKEFMGMWPPCCAEL